MLTKLDSAIISAYSAIEYRQMGQKQISDIYNERVEKFLLSKGNDPTTTKRSIYRKARQLLKNRQHDRENYTD